MSISEISEAKYTLNVGCGGRPKDKASYLGDVRIDVIRSPSVTIIMDAHHLAFVNNVFDEIYCFAVLEHLASPFNALKEMRRVLKPNGKIIVVVPNVWLWRRIYRGIQRRKVQAGITDHKQGWDIFELANLACQVGLKIEEHGWINWYPDKRRLWWIDELLPTPLGKKSMYAVIKRRMIK